MYVCACVRVCVYIYNVRRRLTIIPSLLTWILSDAKLLLIVICFSFFYILQEYASR